MVRQLAEEFHWTPYLELLVCGLSTEKLDVFLSEYEPYGNAAMVMRRTEGYIKSLLEAGGSRVTMWWEDDEAPTYAAAAGRAEERSEKGVGRGRGRARARSPRAGGGASVGGGHGFGGAGDTGRYLAQRRFEQTGRRSEDRREFRWGEAGTGHGTGVGGCAGGTAYGGDSSSSGGQHQPPAPPYGMGLRVLPRAQMCDTPCYPLVGARTDAWTRTWYGTSMSRTYSVDVSATGGRGTGPEQVRV